MSTTSDGNSSSESTTNQDLAVAILAAGQGTRMKSALPKVLHKVGGRSLLGHAIAAAEHLNPKHLTVIVRHDRDQVAAHATDLHPGALIADQDEVPGTGRATEAGLAALDEAAGGRFDGTVVVTASDVPLLDGETLEQLVAAHHSDGNAVTALTTRVADPHGYGRVLRDPETGNMLGVVEEKDATDAQRQIDEVNVSIYAFDADVLRRGLAALGTENASGEKYLTDLVAFANGDGGQVRALIVDDPLTVEGTNDRLHLQQLGAELNRRILERWMLAGVTIVDVSNTWIDVDVELAPDVTILPGVQLYGACQVASGATVGPDCTLTNVTIGEGASVVRTHGSDSVIGPRANVGPFTFLRPGTVLGEGGKIGAYCEVKNAQIGAGTKVPHLSYVGDAEIGEGTNIGAASVTLNYDSVHKHRTKIGSHVRIGGDTMLVAPVTIGDGAFTAAGSVITHDVPAGALGLGRARQTNVPGWTERKWPGTKPADAAAQARDRAAAEALSQVVAPAHEASEKDAR